MSGLASLLIDSSIQRTLSSFAKRHAWAFSQGALHDPSLPSLLSVALLDDLSAVARMSSAINFFLGRPLRSAGAAISGRARGVLQGMGAGRVRGALPHAMPTVPHRAADNYGHARSGRARGSIQWCQAHLDLMADGIAIRSSFFEGPTFGRAVPIRGLA